MKIACPVCNGVNVDITWSKGDVESVRYTNHPTTLHPPSYDNLRLRCRDCGREVLLHDGRVFNQGDRYDLLDHVVNREDVVLLLSDDPDIIDDAGTNTKIGYELYDPDEPVHMLVVRSRSGHYVVDTRTKRI